MLLNTYKFDNRHCAISCLNDKTPYLLVMTIASLLLPLTTLQILIMPKPVTVDALDTSLRILQMQ